jgi:hypothetical protein
MEHRLNLTAMELLWRGSASLEDASVFTGNFISGALRRIGAMRGGGGGACQCLAVSLCCKTATSAAPSRCRVDAFVEQCRRIANATRGPDIMLTIGSDFQCAPLPPSTHLAAPPPS